jgi:hypothetical protein
VAKVIYSLSHWLSGPLRGRIDVSIAKTHRESKRSVQDSLGHVLPVL